MNKDELKFPAMPHNDRKQISTSTFQTYIFPEFLQLIQNLLPLSSQSLVFLNKGRHFLILRVPTLWRTEERLHVR